MKIPQLSLKNLIKMKHDAVRNGRTPVAWKIHPGQWNSFMDEQHPHWREICPCPSTRALFGLPVYNTDGNPKLITK